MGKARKTRFESAPSGSASRAARRLRDATTIKEITEAYCLALFLPCWMYPSFRQRVSDEYSKLPPSKVPDTILPPPAVVAAPLPPPPAPPPPPAAVAPPPPPPRAPTGPFIGWAYGYSPLTPGGPMPEAAGKEIGVDDVVRRQYPAGTRFFENVYDPVSFRLWQRSFF